MQPDIYSTTNLQNLNPANLDVRDNTIRSFFKVLNKKLMEEYQNCFVFNALARVNSYIKGNYQVRLSSTRFFTFRLILVNSPF